MEEIILQAKAGPPKSRLVGNHIEVTKKLANASIVETYKKRRLTGKQPLSVAMAEQRIKAAIRAATDRTKVQAQAHLKKMANHMNELSNFHGKQMTAREEKKIDYVTEQLAEFLQHDSKVHISRQEVYDRLLKVLKEVKLVE